MLTVKCPSCSTGLKLRQAPASGKVKCPKCGSAVAVRAGAAQPAPVAAAAGLSPDDEGFDFSNIQVPSASGVTSVSQFPVDGHLAPYQGPIPGDPLDLVQDENAAPAQSGGGGGQGGGGQGGRAPAPAAKRRNPAVLIGAIGGVAVLLIAGIVVAATQFGGGGDSAPTDVELLAAAQATAPSGYKAYGHEGVIVLMPQGRGGLKLPSVIECSAVESNESGSVYFMGAMNGGKRPLDKDQMRKKAERQLGGEILGGQEVERNGYKGIKGMLDGSIFLPRMKVEVFHHDERFVIIGCAPASMGADPSTPVNRQAEAAEEKIFYDTFKIGPKPSGGWLF